MCQHNLDTKKKSLLNSTVILYLLIITFAVFSGLSDIAILKSIGSLISDAFIKVFKCISLPIISLSIIVTLSSYRSDGILKSVWRKTICYTLSTTLIAAFVSFLLYLIIQPEILHIAAKSAPTEYIHANSYLSYITQLIPETILSPFIQNQILSVLFLSITIGIAIRFIPEPEAKNTVVQFFKGAHSLFMVITKWIIKVIPIGLYGFITVMITEMQTMALKGIGEYILIIVLANLIQGFVILPAWLKLNNISPFKAMKSMSKPLSLAFFSKSSVGTLPVTIQSIEDNLKVPSTISRFVLPLCTSINMNGCAAFIFTTVIYLMQNNGIDVSVYSMLLWVVVATVAAIGNAGVPMGCFFLSASLLASMNVPITMLGLILPLYTLIDMLETSLNVWSDICVTKVVSVETQSDFVHANKRADNMDESYQET